MKFSKKAKRMVSVFLVVALLVTTIPIGTLPAQAVETEFSGGNGTEGDPYLIATKAHLNNVRNHPDAQYKMIADIEFTAADFAAGGDFYNGGKGWEPIGTNDDSAFNGTFDGNGFAVVGIRGKRSDSGTDFLSLFGVSNGVIKNLAVVDGSFTHTTAGKPYVAGIVGYNKGVISHCYSTMEISTVADGGGIAGLNRGSITNCYNVGTIGESKEYGTYCGGIVGNNAVEGTLAQCYNVGKVSAFLEGGLVGRNYGNITQCYYLESDQIPCGMGKQAGVRCSVSQMKSQATLEGFDFETTWQMGDGSDYAFPTLKSVPHKATTSVENVTQFSGGIGTPLSPYLISSASQMTNVKKYPDSCFKLIKNITFTSSWSPIGTAKTPFTGTFDGDGYSISGLTKRLFDYNKGVIKNVSLVNATVTQGGVIAAYNYGTVLNCFSTSEIVFAFSGTVGGLVGTNYGTINNCFYGGKIVNTSEDSSKGDTGGIAGKNDGGTISCCYSAVVMRPKQGSGGLAAENAGTISDSYYHDLIVTGVGSGTEQGTQLTMEQLKSQESFVGFDFSSVWTIDASADYPAPTLRVARSLPPVGAENTTHFAGGSGDLFHPFLLSTKEHIDNIKHYTGTQECFQLTKDITYSGEISSVLFPLFDGVLDGASHSIKGLTFKAAGSDQSVGFVGENVGVIRNLNFENCQMLLTDITESNVGSLAVLNTGIVDRVHIQNDMKIRNEANLYKANIGGIVGESRGVIKNSVASGEMDFVFHDGTFNCYVGGIVGKASSSIVNTVNKTNITMDMMSSAAGSILMHCGGIVGYSNAALKEKVRNEGNINIYSNAMEKAANRVYVGGVVAFEGKGITVLSSNAGNINVNSQSEEILSEISLGGILGRTGNYGGTVEKSYNTGCISGVVTLGSALVGGIAAELEGTIENCYNAGNLRSQNAMNNSNSNGTAGGILGWGMYDSSVSKCYNVGEIVAERAGGITGVAYSTAHKYAYYVNSVDKGVADGDASNTFACTAEELTDYSTLWGLNFNKVWEIGVTSGYQYGTLRGLEHIVTEHTCAPVMLYQCDEEMHWKPCAFCGKQMDIGSHSFQIDCTATCVICDYVLYANHTLNGSWEHDATTHWQTCLSCGEKIEYGAHEYANTGSLPCRVCSARRTLTSITITEFPEKREYKEDEQLDLTGMVITAYYDNNTSAVVTNYTVSGDTSMPGYPEITVTYEGMTATFDITVIPKLPISISITKKPNKTSYREGEAFDKTGMIVTLYYDDDTSEVITDYCRVSGYSSTPGTKKLIITYLYLETTLTVIVKSKVPTSVTSSKYTVSGRNISKIPAGTTVSSLLAGLKEGSYCKVYKGTSVVSGNTAVGTGMTVKILDGTVEKASYTVIVTGDTNGDGGITITDMIAIKAHVLKKSTLLGVYATAADTNGDGGISITDFIQVKAKILGKENVV